MVTAVQNLLDVGVYSPQEAAFYARLRSQTINRWFFGNKHGPAVVSTQFGETDKIISFLDFVQALAIREFRVRYGVSLAKIRTAVQIATQSFGVQYPLAKSHTTYLLDRSASDQKRESIGGEEDDGSFELIICPDQQSPEKLFQLTGKHSKNQVMRPILELYMKNIHYGTLGIAEKYIPWSDGELKITMDPKKHFGEPLLPSGYSVATICDAVRVEGGILEVAKTYGIDPKEVELAIEYFDHLSAPV